jgi:outer membrane protein assembly factor BamB
VDAGSGSLRWSYPTGSDLVSSPAVADGIVYIGSRDGNLYAVDAKTGKRRWRWKAQVTDYSPVVSGGVVYVGYDLELFALDAATGRKHWAFPMNNAVTGTAPAVRDGTVYASGNNTLYAVNAGTGRKRWSLELEGNPSDPVAAAGAVFVTCDDGYLYAVRA